MATREQVVNLVEDTYNVLVGGDSSDYRTIIALGGLFGTKSNHFIQNELPKALVQRHIPVVTHQIDPNSLKKVLPSYPSQFLTVYCLYSSPEVELLSPSDHQLYIQALANRVEPVLDHGHIVVAHFSQRPGWWYQRNCQLRSRTKPVWLNSYTYSELSKLAHLLDGGQQHVLDLYRSTLGLPCLVEPYVYILDSSPPDNTPSSLFQIDPCDPNKIDHALAYAGTFGLFRRTDMHLFSGLLLEIVSHLVKRPLSEREYPFGFFTNSLTGVVHSGISGDSTRYIYGLSDAHFDPLDSLPPHLLSGYKTEPGTRSRFSHLLVEFLGPTKVSLYHQAIAEYYTSLICLSIESLYKNPLPSLEQDSVITQVAGYLNEFAYHRGTSFRLENPLQTPPGISDFVLPSLLESLQLVPSQLRDQVRQTLIVNSQTWPDPEMFGPAGLFPNEFFRRLFPTLT